MNVPDINTVPKLVQRAKRDGLPISEYTLRRLIRQGVIPARYIGHKAVASYSALIRYLSCEDGADNMPTTMVTTGIRRVDL